MKFFRKNIKNCVYIFILTIFLLASEVLCNKWFKLKLINSYNNTPYNDYSIYFTVSEETREAITMPEMEQISGKCIIYKYNNNKYGEYEIVCIGKNALDFKKKSSEFIIGEYFENYAFAGISSQYNLDDIVIIDGITYYIKGILNRHISEAVNTGIFYIKNSETELIPNQTYILASDNYREVNKTYKKIKNIVQSQGQNIKKTDIRNTAFQDFVQYKNTGTILLLLLLIFYIICIIMFQYIWIKFKKKESFVYHLLGYGIIDCKITAEYFILWLISGVLSIIMYIAITDEFYYGVRPIFQMLSILYTFVALSCISTYRILTSKGNM